MYKIFLTIIFIISYAITTYSQTGIITTVAGNGTAGYTGDGGIAIAATFNQSNGMAVDNAGNLYFADLYNNVIRKVNTSGIITTYAGNGIAGFSGDGGPASSAEFNTPYAVAIDPGGNIYIDDHWNFRIRKINITTGIISTIAGNGYQGYAGDGGPATAASLESIGGICVDNAYNLYLTDSEISIVRKINTSGIITTFAGSGFLGGYSGDGGPATAAMLLLPANVCADASGNIYISDLWNNRIRMVNTSGIINTYAGNGTSGYSGDGGPATAAELYNPGGISIDATNNLYISDITNNVIRKVSATGIISSYCGNDTAGYRGDGGLAVEAELNGPTGLALGGLTSLYIIDNQNNRIRKVSQTPYYTSDSFSVYIQNLCLSLQFAVVTDRYDAGMYIQTYYGDGSSDTISVAAYGTIGNVTFSHVYSSTGNYTIKQLLYNTTGIIDSATFTYQYTNCNTFPLIFYYDSTGTCVYNDSTDPMLILPVLIEVDSNGIAIDTISATSGLYYTAYGASGDIYTFKLLATPSGLITSCPTTGIIYDTIILSALIAPAKYMGFSCDGSSAFDLAIFSSMLCGRHQARGTIIVSNNYCIPENATVTFNFSPKYLFYSSSPSPLSVFGNTVTWSEPGLSADFAEPVTINFLLEIPGGTSGVWLTPGDTVNANCNVNPVTGDLYPANNYFTIIDTVKSSYDPNYMTVAPEGDIPSDTTLLYAIEFENTGNDTALNIYILDTLSPNLDPSTLRIVTSSATMFTQVYNNGGQNILKFDFPNINLPDTSYPNLCNGLVMFNINTKHGLTLGSTIFNHAGIFFDDNPAVITDTVEDIVSSISTKIQQIVNNNRIELFPNPADNELTLKIDVGSFNSYLISDMVGQPIMEGIINGNIAVINISHLVTGIYFIKLTGVNGSELRKIIKE